jgi:hypothetical protein
MSAIRRSRATFPAAPSAEAPANWVSIDPACGAKPTLITVWRGADPVEFVAVRHEDHAEIEASIAGCDLVVLEGGGFVGANASAALRLERVRGRFETWATAKRIPYIEITPDGWRGVLGLPSRPRQRAVLAGREYVLTMARSLEFAGKATNDDRRAAMLVGWACVQAWGWR